MKLNMAGGGKERTVEDLVPKGNQEARCIGVADLGTHSTTYEGQPTGDFRFIRVMFEFPDHLITYTKDGEEITAPKVLTEDFKVIGGDRSNLTKLIVSWFEGEEVLETSAWAGKPAMVEVIHKEDKKGQLWGNIGKNGIKPMVAKYVAGLAPQHNPDMTFSIDEHGFESKQFDLQWKGTKKKIMESLEYEQYLNGPKMEENDEDLPFK